MEPTFSTVCQRSVFELEIREVPTRGRGVFCTTKIQAGSLIEECPVILVPAEETESLTKTNLANYYFAWGGTGDDAAIALGYGSLYNHARDPNAMYVKKYDERLIAFFAIKDINPNEEITVNYHGGFGDRSDTWFEIE